MSADGSTPIAVYGFERWAKQAYEPRRLLGELRFPRQWPQYRGLVGAKALLRKLVVR